METSPLDQACDAVGSQQALADALNIKSPSITEWRQRGKVPAERCIAIEEATKRQVTRYDLRPDVFGPAPKGRKKKSAELAVNDDEQQKAA